MVRIPRGEFEPHAPASPGSRRTNHSSPYCDGDSKSLKVTRKIDGSIDAVCYRCGGKGWVPPAGYFRPAEQRQEQEEQEVDGYTLPGDATTNVRAWSKEATAWLAKAGIPPTNAAEWGFMWTQEESTLYIPIVQETSAYGQKLVGFAKRRFNPKGYLTLSKTPASLYGFLRGPSVDDWGTGTLVVVEDMLSGHRCKEVADVIALCGTALKPEALAFIARQRYNRATIFLDGDNRQVKQAARKIAASLSWMETKIVETGQDPKSYSKEMLEKFILS